MALRENVVPQEPGVLKDWLVPLETQELMAELVLLEQQACPVQGDHKEEEEQRVLQDLVVPLELQEIRVIVDLMDSRAQLETQVSRA